MKCIVISPPSAIDNEALLITQLLDGGAFAVHLRKPGMAVHSCARLIESIPEGYRRHIVLHDNFELCRRYHLQGVHLNSRNSYPPEGHNGSLSCSCHSIDEVKRRKKDMDYVFLSPIFHSISKQGVAAAFSDRQLSDAATSGIIDQKVVALGGVTPSRIAQLRAWHFGGAALLGDIWRRAGSADLKAYMQRLVSM